MPGSRAFSRILLVDDSAAFRAALSSVLSRQPSIHVIGEAADGAAALAQVDRLRPDVVVMDVMMPKLDGIETARAILRDHGRDTAVLLVSALARVSSSHEHRGAIEALRGGIVDFGDKPILVGPASDAHIAQLVRRIKAAHDLIVQRRHHALMNATAQTAPAGCAVIVIAASTGGLDALRHVVDRLSPASPPVVIAQHVEADFAARFAGQLQLYTRLRVVPVSSADVLHAGRLYVVGTHANLRLSGEQVMASSAPASQLAPTADLLFTSAAQWYGRGAVGVVLTGMGQDGAAGLKSLRDAGGWTIAQDNRTSLVYGMPRAAAEVGACCEILPLPQIADRLAALALQPHVTP